MGGCGFSLQAVRAAEVCSDNEYGYVYMLISANVLCGFIIPAMRIERFDTALSEKRFAITLEDQGKRFIVAPKMADLIFALQQQGSPESVARKLSEVWGQEISVKDLTFIIENHMVPSGLAYTEHQKSSARPPVKKNALRQRLLSGHFYWWLIKDRFVERICSRMSFLYDPLSVFFTLALIIASRFLLYSTIDWHFYRQLVLDFSATEYLASLGLLIVVVLIHEFGHAAAQINFGLPAGGIGFQIYHFMPAFFADVDASWSLKPKQRAVVDVGGIYFQSLAASVLYIIYLNTDFSPLLATVLISDVLSLITLNPFLRFDGYWLLADALALPNLHTLSSNLMKHYFKRLSGKDVAQEGIPAMGRARLAAVMVYAVLKDCFLVVIAFMIVSNVAQLYSGAASTLSQFASRCMEGLRTYDVALAVSSFIRLVLFVLLLLAMTSLVVSLASRLWRLAQASFVKIASRSGLATANAAGRK